MSFSILLVLYLFSGLSLCLFLSPLYISLFYHSLIVSLFIFRLDCLTEPKSLGRFRPNSDNATSFCICNVADRESACTSLWEQEIRICDFSTVHNISLALLSHGHDTDLSGPIPSSIENLTQLLTLYGLCVRLWLSGQFVGCLYIWHSLIRLQLSLCFGVVRFLLFPLLHRCLTAF